MLENLIKVNNLKGEPFSNENIWQVVSDVREETEAEHERNINDITCDAVDIKFVFCVRFFP